MDKQPFPSIETAPSYQEWLGAYQKAMIYLEMAEVLFRRIYLLPEDRDQVEKNTRRLVLMGQTEIPVLLAAEERLRQRTIAEATGQSIVRRFKRIVSALVSSEKAPSLLIEIENIAIDAARDNKWTGLTDQLSALVLAAVDGAAPCSGPEESTHVA